MSMCFKSSIFGGVQVSQLRYGVYIEVYTIFVSHAYYEDLFFEVLELNLIRLIILLDLVDFESNHTFII